MQRKDFKNYIQLFECIRQISKKNAFKEFVSILTKFYSELVSKTEKWGNSGEVSRRNKKVKEFEVVKDRDL
ncbi:hypothetical protein BUQ74_08520 [Leptospira weilii serovar Heyan]|uniref:Uncharacterized protein n=1 Tax=Leptospira weilii str. UI 13098 TaxID=1088542 RepID=M6Q267_9LEPT|nr:hypothetical protein LEP1GSC051_3312 [Leptospira sp. P2653]EMN89626.1 hypothetical protein LEP1GSC108_2695 [Leptospira weilii str. UI 13098]OMI17699.1 hypothetical protein BUQ74_08520 [Leptospira weilii serovar Heyan]